RGGDRPQNIEGIGPRRNRIRTRQGGEHGVLVVLDLLLLGGGEIPGDQRIEPVWSANVGSVDRQVRPLRALLLRLVTARGESSSQCQTEDQSAIHNASPSGVRGAG